MGDYVDSYCERIAPGFWGEPLNSISNLMFLIAAVAIAVLTRRAGRDGRIGYPLAVIVGLIFLGSSAFHTTATRWGAALDSAFIGVFLLYYIVVFANLFWRLPWRLAWLAAPAFLLFTALVAVTLGQVFRGPGMYLSAVLALFILAAALRWSKHPDRRPHWVPFAAAGLVFTISLTFRTIDSAVCASFPAGTHFVWHTLNAATLFIVSLAALRRRRELREPPVGATPAIPTTQPQQPSQQPDVGGM